MKHNIRLLMTAACLLLGLLAVARPAQAYPWMLKHSYTGCAVCHTDPSGGFLLTPYGRAQTQAILSTFGRGPEGNEVDRRSEFGFGVPLPSWLNAGASAREAYMLTRPSGGPTMKRAFLMQAELKAAVTLGAFEVAGSLGYAPEGAREAAITRKETDNLVARTFWLGYRFSEDKNTVLRVGRLALPFGVRSPEHNWYVRSTTGTNMDAQQEWGASLFHQGEKYRAELMVLVGNYQVRPDGYRSRGYAGYEEWMLSESVALGVSSSVRYQRYDPYQLTDSVTGAHGPMVRWAVNDKWAILAEAELLHRTLVGGATTAGVAALAFADWEPWRGVHTMFTTEAQRESQLNAGLSNREWLTALWFIYPHVDLRVDGIWSTTAIPEAARMNSITALGQVHVSL